MTEASTIAVGAETSTPVPGHDEARSLTSDAWRSLKKNPIFWISTVLIVAFVLMAAWPSLFTSVDPAAAVLKNARERPSADAWFGRDIQGYDIYSRTIYGARASILVGVFASIATVLIGGAMGVIAGYYGGWLDAIVSRITDIFFAIPLLLGGILYMATFPNNVDSPYLLVVGKVVLVLSIFGWPGLARLMRSSVLQVKPNDYVQAARALGASPWRIIRSHVLPNALAPMIVVATINLGVFIATEATLSFLGIGLTPPAISWGVAISDAIVALRTTPHILLFPSLFLSLAVLAFIMLGDAVRDAFDPKSR
ncbi:oligopeptide transport system permease protein [Phycicoccus badiiscoriae]|uniref:Oligopeptide transport system permease protein n=1 Tax=Pedococcus badiiscoriae TaxID=642776 RepID=A0A852WAL0_9MICO|nr:ABC transporter permease [Pedococcus badiiscoriae]NYG06103.1 oligopeptide transport system permease protein [Pedococcus badiiscoriae]